MVVQRTYLVPLLDRGRHAHPGRGGCLVELAGCLLGGPWSDRPPSVDPVLAGVARAVNDRTGEEARAGLIRFAPWLVSPVSPPGAARAAALASASAAAAVVTDRAVARRLRAAEDRLRRAHVGAQTPRRATALVRLAAAAVTRSEPGPHDTALRALLVESLGAYRAVAGLSRLDAGRLGGGMPARQTVAVVCWLASPDGAESTHLRCAADLDRWPTDLVADWRQRRAELTPPALRRTAQKDRSTGGM